MSTTLLKMNYLFVYVLSRTNTIVAFKLSTYFLPNLIEISNKYFMQK